MLGSEHTAEVVPVRLDPTLKDAVEGSRRC